MKRILFFVFCTLSFVSCKQSYKVSERAEEMYIDSIASYAWGNLKFGMSKSEVEAISQYHPLDYQTTTSINYSDNTYSYLVPSEYNQQISKELDLTITPKLSLVFTGSDSDELIKARLETEGEQYEEYGDYQFIKDCRRLVSLISAKYGEENLIESNFRCLKDSTLEYSPITIARWKIGHKTITFYLWIYSDQKRYSLDFSNDLYPHEIVKVPDQML